MQYNDYLIKIEIKFVHFYSCLSYFLFFSWFENESFYYF
jgi:hypothetical protein